MYRLLWSVLLAGTFLQGAHVPGGSSIYFEENRGQFADAVRFSSDGQAHRVFFTADELVFLLRGAETGVMRVRLVDSPGPAMVRGERPLPGRINYLIGRDRSQWRRGVPTFGAVRYEQVYEGIDLVVHGGRGQLEYDFEIAPGVEPSRIRLAIDGADSLEIDADGNLVAGVGEHQITQKRPLIYQETDGGRTAVEGRFKLLAGNRVAFEVEAYDRDRTLVIDPEVVFSTYLGGSDRDIARGLALDADENIYVTGWTFSPDYPTMDPLQGPIASTLQDVIVSKLSPDGSTLLYSTYLGSEDGETGYDVAVDTQGAIYVVGNAGTGFPTTPGAFQPEAVNVSEAFVAKLSPDGSELVYSTLLGGARGDTAWAVEVDEEGHAYVVGQTASDDFPVTGGSFGAARTVERNQVDGFLAKLDATGGTLIYSGFLGGDETDRATGIAVRQQRAYVVGQTQSDNFPTTLDAYSTANAGTVDTFVSKIDIGGSGFEFSTYLGGSNVDYGLGIDVDVVGNIYVTGYTTSRDYPTTPGVIGPERIFNNDVFLTKLTPNASDLVYSTYFGTSSVDNATSVAVDTQGSAYVTGWTSSSTFPLANALQPVYADDSEIFLTKFSHDAAALLYSSYFGGSSGERSGDRATDPGGDTVAVTAACEAVVVGESDSTDITHTEPFQAANAGAEDVLIGKFDLRINDGLPTIACRGAVLAPLSPTLRKLAPRSIATVFGRDFTTQTIVQPEVDEAGRVATRLGDVCVEVNGRRAPLFFVSPGQINFQVPTQTAAGWRGVRVVRDCDGGNIMSAPQWTEIMPVVPEFFNFVSNSDGVNPIAALHQNQVDFVGPPELFGGGVTTPAVPGEFVSVFPTGLGPTQVALADGQIPGAANPVTGQVQLTLGGRAIPPEDIAYVGAAPCCAGLDQVTFRVPPDMPAGNHELIITINNVASPAGPFIAVVVP